MQRNKIIKWPVSGVAEQVVGFVPSGSTYMMACGRRVSVHDVGGSGGLLATYQASDPQLCLTFLSDQVSPLSPSLVLHW